MGSRVRIGVIGAGFGTTVHIPAFQAEGLDVVAVCTRRPETGRAAAERFTIPNVFTDHREMLRMDGLDAVSVVSPRTLHHAMTIDALDAGKHVICEKPFATELGDAREMWQRARVAGVTAMIAHEFRFAPARARVGELIDEGYIGSLHMALVSLVRGNRQGFGARPWSDSDDAESGGGLLWSQGSHYVDCLRHWFGEVEWVSGQVFTHAGERTVEGSDETVRATADDAFNITMGFVSGGWACLTASQASAFGSGVRVEIYGRDGTLVTPQANVGSANPLAHGPLLGARTGESGLEELDMPARLDPYDDEGHDGLMPMRMLAREFLRGIAEGISPAPSFWDGYRCMQVLHAARESSSTGSVVRIPAES